MPSLRARRSELSAGWTSLKTLALIFIFAACFTLPALFAQTTSGRMVGRVADPTGATLPNVKVTLTNQGTGISRNVVTNDSGDYNFIEVVPGTYTVQFELTGFKKNVQKDVIVDIDRKSVV